MEVPERTSHCYASIGEIGEGVEGREGTINTGTLRNYRLRETP